MMNWVHTPICLQKMFPQMIWQVPTSEKEIFLTFDDGPTPGVTPQVLAFLLEYQAKASFFCLGARIEQYPELFHEIKAAGHVIGNHGYKHLSGFTTSHKLYLQNVLKGEELSGSHLFRPPYGRITPWMANSLKKHHQLIMWTTMSMDFNAKITTEQCFQNAIGKIAPGTILVLHDSEKAAKNLLIVLPRLLQWCKENGFKAKTLSF
jgi:Predicted xylanase/chitin deacetylase